MSNPVEIEMQVFSGETEETPENNVIDTFGETTDDPVESARDKTIIMILSVLMFLILCGSGYLIKVNLSAYLDSHFNNVAGAHHVSFTYIQQHRNTKG
ncbi:hypothetical protein CAEBREN_11812 [Caenorhabditis brenneri]|uniref:Uncharacterized protein n=1 Tax=Caenorhabditis brenneri TaxID=135651 RepID=G0PBT3_CAEBE|nr:hypothetical protein CAEBREN_11812 [Caenorhabditis brenneri]